MDSSKRYYEKNKDKILAKEKETKRWVEYYQRNKDAIRERNLVRYYAKSGRERPPPKQPPTPPDNSKLEKLEALVAELRELVPQVMKPRRVKKPAQAEAPGVPAEAPGVPAAAPGLSPV
jgi:hypothetical protein